MKKVQYESLGHLITVNVPSTIEEFDQMAGKAGAALEEAIDHVVMHSLLGKVRPALAALVEEETKIKQTRDTGRKTLVNGVETPILEELSEKAYLAMVAAQQPGYDPEAEVGPFQKLADRLSAGGDKEIKFDPKAQKRTGLGPVLAKAYKENAAKFLADAKNLPKVLKNLGKVLGKTIEVVGTTPEEQQTSLGWLLKAYAVEMEKRNTQGLTS